MSGSQYRVEARKKKIKKKNLFQDNFYLRQKESRLQVMKIKRVLWDCLKEQMSNKTRKCYSVSAASD